MRQGRRERLPCAATCRSRPSKKRSSRAWSASSGASMRSSTALARYRRVGLLDETIEGWQGMFANNLHPVFYMSRLVAPHMIALQVEAASSTSAWRMPTRWSHSRRSRRTISPRQASSSLPARWRRVLGPHSITVNAISPGFVASGSAPAEELQKMVKNIPAGYIGELSDAVFGRAFPGLGRWRGTSPVRNLHLSGGWGI